MPGVSLVKNLQKLLAVYPVGGEGANAPVDGELQLLFVVRHWRMDLRQVQSELGPETPAKTATDDTRPEHVQPGIRVLHCEREVFRYILEECNEWVNFADAELPAEDLVDE